jgi:hypothetical protein
MNTPEPGAYQPEPVAASAPPEPAAAPTYVVDPVAIASIPSEQDGLPTAPAGDPRGAFPLLVQTFDRTSTSEGVRAWARATGRNVSSRGRLAKAIMDDYNWEHPEAPYISEN